MSYESLFDLTVYNFLAYLTGVEGTAPAMEHETAVAQLRDISPGAEAAIDESGSSQGWASWDDMEKEVMSFSRQYPSLLFVVTVHAENCAQWRFFAHNGRRQTTEGYVVYDGMSPDNWSDNPLYTS